MQALFTPWRYQYIRSTGESCAGCFFCEAAAEPNDPQRLVVHEAEHHLVMLNKHPYTNGHVMVVPKCHLTDPAAASRDAQQELWPLVLLSTDALRRAYGPHGFNVGLNLGRVAGAGVPGHFHVHVVPRWDGDTNFMSVLAETRLVPERLDVSWGRLRLMFAGGDASQAGKSPE